MIGTGSAFPKHSYNSCYVIKSHGGLMLVDAGGGNGIFNAINESGIKLSEIHHIFITHTHTDHILGAVWLIRGIMAQAEMAVHMLNRVEDNVKFSGV